MRKSQIYLNQGKKYKMKRILACALSLILCLSSISVTSSAGTIGDMAKKYEDELNAISQDETIPFTPVATESYSTDIDWFSSDFNRASLSILLTFDLTILGYSDPSLGLLNYTSYIGMGTNNTYIIAGMYDNHTFEIFYSPNDHSAVYHVAPTTFSEAAVKSMQETTMSSSCSKYYTNDRNVIKAFAEALSSQ